MIGPDEFLYWCTVVAFLALSAAFLILVYRILTGPTTPDRVLALDMMVAVAVGFIATFGVRSGYFVYLDIAIALGLVGFLSTVALARFVLIRRLSAPDVQSIETGRSDGGRDGE